MNSTTLQKYVILQYKGTQYVTVHASLTAKQVARMSRCRRGHLKVLCKNTWPLCAVLMWHDNVTVRLCQGAWKTEIKRKIWGGEREEGTRAGGHVSWHGRSGSQLPWLNPGRGSTPPTHPHTHTHTHTPHTHTPTPTPTHTHTHTLLICLPTWVFYHCQLPASLSLLPI